MEKKKRKWVKKRHARVYNFLRPFFKLHFKRKYNLTVKPCESVAPSPALIMSNHLTTLDPFMVALSFKRPLYFIASDDLFTIPIVSPLIRFLAAPIPKSKSKSDLGTVRNTLQVLKEGGSVMVFPEGNRSLSGGNWGMDKSCAKLAKMCKVPLVLYNIKGGYGADPRWGKGVRKGRMTCGAVKIVSTEELSKMSVDEIFQLIKETLVSDDCTSGVRFKSRRKAEYLERAIYYCENCGSFNTMCSEKDKLYCKLCDFTAEYTEDLHFKPLVGKCAGTTVEEWFCEQFKRLENHVKNTDGVLFGDKCVKVRLIYGGKRHSIGAADIRAEKDGILVNLKKGKILRFNFSALYGVTVLGKRKINFYLPDDKTLQIKGFKRFNSVKYLHVYELYKKENQQ